MRRSWNRTAWVTVMSLPLLGGANALAQAPVAPAPAAPQTMWNWLGVPKQPLAGVINREGNFPGCEKLPPLKKIADPANLASKNPAIKKAAEIKAEEDLAKQKIKAIKYLAEIGCGGCYPGVAEALAASLDDCTEAVRYEAVKAILATSACGQDKCDKKCARAAKSCNEAAHDAVLAAMKKSCARLHMLCGKPGPDGVTLKSKLGLGRQCGPNNQCQPQQCGRCGCGNGSCCTSEILNKLSTMAHERDDRGCWKEPSPRVRAMAAQALRACRHNVRPYTEAPVPMPEEVPVTPDSGKTPETSGGRQPETTTPQQRPGTPETVQPKSTSLDIDAADQVAVDEQSVTVAAAEPEIAEIPVTGAESASDADAPVISESSEPEATVSALPVQPAAAQAEPVTADQAPIAPTPEDLLPVQTAAPQRAKSPAARPAPVRETVARPLVGFFRVR